MTEAGASQRRRHKLAVGDGVTTSATQGGPQMWVLADAAYIKPAR